MIYINYKWGIIQEILTLSENARNLIHAHRQWRRAMRKRILFVDDEEMVLQGLKRMLRSCRDEWDMVFVDSGAKALDTMAQAPFDIVVADMRMPVMNGAELLHEVMKRYPLTVRLILSGHSDNELIFKAMGDTHQYLSKPCDPETLQSVLRRAIGSTEILHNPELKILIGQMNALPSLPALYHEIMEKLKNPNVQMGDITGIIARDLGMTAKILQLVNSAYFGVPDHVTDLNAAVSFLGLNVIASLFVSIHIFSEFKGLKIQGFSMEDLWKHSLDTATLAHKICKIESRSNTIANEAFVAGILHDSGRIILAANFPKRYQDVIAMAKQEHCEISAAEKMVFEHTHSEVGGYMLSLWGLPLPVVQAVSYHHDPGFISGQTFCALTAVHVANSLGDLDFGNKKDIASSPLDLNYLKSMNLLDRLPAWRKLIQAEGPDPAFQSDTP
jgi:HD-like signal output (HDOD) protein/CheY-like chemotaxis protein